MMLRGTKTVLTPQPTRADQGCFKNRLIDQSSKLCGYDLIFYLAVDSYNLYIEITSDITTCGSRPEITWWN